MEIDSFRYLFSALIQVFGALIAVDAIFLVLRYESITRKLDVIVKLLGLNIITAVRYEEVFDYRISPHLFSDFEAGATTFQIFSSKQLESIVSGTKDDIAKIIESLSSILKDQDKAKGEKTQAKSRMARLKQCVKTINSIHEQYISLRKVKTRFPTIVIATMGVPAVLATMFAVGLLKADLIGSYGYLLDVSRIAIILSVVGFFFIIYFAVLAFRE